MILGHDEILSEIKKKKIAIKPFRKENLGPVSYDLTLDDKFKFFKDTIIKVNNKTDYKKYTKSVNKKSIILHPGDYVLGITKEQIKLPSNLFGMLSGRTRFARLGLAVHVTANFVNPGTNNKTVLEIKNLSQNTIELKAGTRVCQIIFCQVSSKTKNLGKFTKQVNF